MSFDLSDFNPEEVPASDVIPAGTYRVCIVKSEMKMTKKAKESGNPADGTMLKLECRVLDGPQQNQPIFVQLNYRNASKKAEAIGQRQLKSIYTALGVKSISNSAELHNKPMMAEVVVRQDSGFEAQNDVKKFMKAGAASPTPATAQPANTAASQPATATQWGQQG